MPRGACRAPAPCRFFSLQNVSNIDRHIFYPFAIKSRGLRGLVRGTGRHSFRGLLDTWSHDSSPSAFQA